MPPSVSTEAEIEVVLQKSESASNFVKTYRKVIGQEPSDAEIAHHLECMRQYDVVSWINPGDHHRADVLAHKGIQLVESSKTHIYHWVAA